jgi:hypothetical protein
MIPASPNPGVTTLQVPSALAGSLGGPATPADFAVCYAPPLGTPSGSFTFASTKTVRITFLATAVDCANPNGGIPFGAITLQGSVQ